jgi:uncharacterized membrane protein (UPF0127 family)
LSGQDNVAKGMFFTFAHPKRLAFWMKDTTQALSIGFFDVSGRLINIEDMVPSSTQLYFSADDAVSALELSPAQFKKLRLGPSTKLVKRDCQ